MWRTDRSTTTRVTLPWEDHWPDAPRGMCRWCAQVIYGWFGWLQRYHPECKVARAEARRGR